MVPYECVELGTSDLSPQDVPLPFHTELLLDLLLNFVAITIMLNDIDCPWKQLRGKSDWYFFPFWHYFFK